MDDRLREIEDILWDNTGVNALDLEATRKRDGRVEVSRLEAEHIVAQVSALQQALREAREALKVRELEGQIDRLTLDLHHAEAARERAETQAQRLLPLARAWATHTCKPDDWRQEYGATTP